MLLSSLPILGEYFIRYRNLDFDDLTEGDDSSTRIAAATLFLAGIAIQICISLYLMCKKNKHGKHVVVRSMLDLASGSRSPFHNMHNFAVVSMSRHTMNKPPTSEFEMVASSEHSSDEDGLTIMF